MTSNALEFSLELDRFVDQKVPEFVRDTRDAVALESHKGVVMMTPVDTGRARGNWQMTAGTPADGYSEDVFDLSGGATLAAGQSALAAARDPFTPIWLHNGVPYIGHLNNGSLRSRAIHMVERTVERIRRMFA